MSVISIRNAAKFQQTVLIVDDQMVALNIHQAIFESLGLNINVVSMQDPVEALAWAKNKQIDLIVTDFSMGEMNGIQFIESFNRSNMCKNMNRKTPIIVISLLKNKYLDKALVDVGAYAYLKKPVKASSLARMARFLLINNQACYNGNQLAS